MSESQNSPIIKKVYSCECGKQYNYKNNLFRHGVKCKIYKAVGHQNSEPRQVNKSNAGILKCPACLSTYRNTQNLKRHLNRCPQNKAKRVCQFTNCGAKFFHETVALIHMMNEHNIELNVFTYNFNSYNEYIKWKDNEERNNYISFKMQSSKVFSNHLYRSFICTHNTCYNKLYIPKTNSKNKKGCLPKNISCSARILTNESLITGTVKVKYYNNHSHALNFENTKFYNLSKSTINVIKNDIDSGIPPLKIRDKFLLDFNSRNIRNQVVLNKEHFIPIKNIRQQEYVNKQNKCLDKDDAKSVMMLVEMFQKESYDLILLYKPSHLAMKVGPSDPVINDNSGLK